MDGRRLAARCAAAALIVIVACGGGSQGPATGPSRILEVFTPPSGTQAARWDTRAQMATARTQAAAGVIGGRLYVAGGSDGTRSLTSLEVYDPAADSWTTRAPMPTARHGAAAAVVDGRLYVAGGVEQRENRHLAGLEVYDPATDMWSVKKPMTVARYQARAVAIGSKLYVIGGCVGWCAPTTTEVEVYDPVTDTWARLSPMSFPRGYAYVAAVGGGIVAAGGCCGTTQTGTTEMGTRVEAYDPAADRWTTKASHYIGSDGAAASIGRAMYTAGPRTVEAYDPATDTWAALPPMPTRREHPVAGAIDGRLYVASGTAVGGGATPTPAPPPSAPPLGALLAGAGDLTFTVTFRVTITGTVAASGTETWYVRGGASRFDFSSPQGAVSVYTLPAGTFVCTAMVGARMCLAVPAATALDQDPSAALETSVRDDPDRFTSTFEGTRQIAGRAAQCYTVTAPSTSGTRLCYTSTGIPLLVESSAGGVTTVLEATDVGTSVSDADLALPVPPTKLPGAP